MKAYLAAGLLFFACCASAFASGYSDFVSGISLQGDNDDLAIGYFNSALSDPQLLSSLRPVVLFDRAQAYLREKKLDLALADLSASLALAPDFDAYATRASLYEAQGRNDLSLADENAAVALRPDIPEGYLTRAGFYVRQTRFADALADYTTAMKVSPSDPDNQVMRSWVYLYMGNYSDAMDDADKVLRETDYKWFGAYLARAAIYEEEGDLDRAERAAKDAVRLSPKDVLGLLTLGQLQWEEKKYSDAAETLRSAAGYSPAEGYTAMWLTIARADAKIDDDLPARAAAIDLTKWPGAMIEFYQGKADMAAVRAQAHDDPFERVGHGCEADFYAGQLGRIQGHPDDAKLLFAAAAAQCPVGYPERWFANLAMKAAP